MSKRAAVAPTAPEEELSSEESHSSLHHLGVMRRIKFRASGRGERHHKHLAIELSTAGKPRKTGSEKSRAKWRADKARDEKLFSFINTELRQKRPVRVTNSSADTVSAAKKHLEDAKLSGTRIIPRVGLPHWDHADPHLKMLGWGMASWSLGAVPFSLHLSEIVVQAAKEDRRGLARHLQDRISRHLRERLPDASPGFWFAVEQGTFEQPHIHGAIEILEGREDQIRAALKAAGGSWKSPVRQLTLSPRRNAITWVGYSTKWLYGSKLRLRDDKTTGASNSIRKAARTWYLDARRTGLAIYP